MIRKIVSQNASEQSICLLDQGNFDGWLYTHEGIYIAIRWADLKGIDNASIGKIPDRATLETRSLCIDPQYLVGILNSSIATNFIRETRRDHVNLYPDDFKALPIPDIALEEQQPIIALVTQLNALALEFFNFRRAGWIIHSADQNCTAPAIITAGTAKAPISRAKISWGFHIIDSGATVSDAKVKGDTLARGRGNTVIEFALGTSERAKQWLARQFKTHGDETLATLEARNLEMPASIAAAEAALTALETQEQAVREKMQRFKTLRAEVDQLVAALYEPAHA